MTPVSQIIWKNRDRFDTGTPLLLVRPPADELARNLCAQGFDVKALCHSHAAHAGLVAAGIESQFAVGLSDSGPCEQLVLFQPREKPLLDMMLGLSGSWLSNTGRFWLAGANRAGIRSAGKRLASHFNVQRKIDSARHCVLYQAQDAASGNDPDIESYFTSWSFHFNGRELQIAGLPGVFAHGHVDEGSQLLAETLINPERVGVIGGRVLDFGCGAGVIAVALAGAYPETELTLLDDSAIALAAAERTLQTNGMEADLVASDGLTQMMDDGCERFDWIVSNPPFHTGVAQDLGIAQRFIRDCPRLLTPRGRLCLVANVHLPYGRWLQELFDKVQVIASDRAYNIWLAHS